MTVDTKVVILIFNIVETKELATRITVAIDRLGLDISASFHSESC